MSLIGGLAAQPTPFRISSASTYLWLRASTSATRYFPASARPRHGFCRELRSASGQDLWSLNSEKNCCALRERTCENGSECGNEHSGNVPPPLYQQAQPGFLEYRSWSGNKIRWVKAYQSLNGDKGSTINQNNPPQVDNDFKLFSSSEAQCVYNRKEGGVSSAMISPSFSRDISLSSPDTLKFNVESVSSATTFPLIETQKMECSFENNSTDEKSFYTITNGTPVGMCEFQSEIHEKLFQIHEKVLVVDNDIIARQVVGMLTNQYSHLVHACDTEVAKIDVKRESPVDHGEIICLSIYSGPNVDFGNGKNCIWVDVLDGGRNVLLEFAPFFEHPSIKKVWHNYSFDNHILENYGFKVSGFHADTMHMARLWNSSRRSEGGYSLEALTSDPKIMANSYEDPEEQSYFQNDLLGKVSMKSIFGRKKIKKDGSEGKIIVIPPVEELQRNERVPWIGYSAFDSICTLNLYFSLKKFLLEEKWYIDGKLEGHMFGFYEQYWKPFGELLVKMETEGMLVDRSHLADIQKLAYSEQETSADRFRNWASKYCPDAKHMNVGSDVQLRQLFFGGRPNSQDPSLMLPYEKTFMVPNVDKIIEEGLTSPRKNRKITLHGIVDDLESDFFTSSGWPSVSTVALKSLAGKITPEDLQLTDNVVNELEEMNGSIISETELSIPSCNPDTSCYGRAYTAFGEGQEGRDACFAIASLCVISAINILISNFILPLQGRDVSGKDERIHCSLNINTETGRLSARRPNLQNQPALEKDRYKIRKAFIAAPGNSLIVADYGQLELRILAHLAGCKSMLDAFKAGGDFHSRTAMNMYPHILEAVENKKVLLEWNPQPGEETPPVPLLKDAFGSERRKAKMLNFSIAYGKTAIGLARDWQVSVEEARETVMMWYKERQEVLHWQRRRKNEAIESHYVRTLLGRSRNFPSKSNVSFSMRNHIERAAINTPVQGSAADVAMCAMLEISKNEVLKKLGWRLLLQVHDEMILEGPSESSEMAKDIVIECMSKPFDGKNILQVDLTVDAKCAQNWYSAK